MQLRVGQLICFVRNSAMYAAGMRTGIVRSVDTPVEDFLRSEADRLGYDRPEDWPMSWMLLRGAAEAGMPLVEVAAHIHPEPRVLVITSIFAIKPEFIDQVLAGDVRDGSLPN